MENKLNHQEIGLKQDLFLPCGDISPGCWMLLPHGTRVYNRLLDFIKKEYKNRGFEEVITPIIFKNSLWQTSGHWDKYQDNMFCLCIDDSNQPDYSICPMNCPKACWIYNARPRSYRELPLRLADFSLLHRNEPSGSLTSLFRLRSFHQDDSHIFCQESEIEKEINGCLDFLDFVYGKFQFDYQLELSTRPEQFIGGLELWDQAEQQLSICLNKLGKSWKLNSGDGAFYGPKIDVHVKDSLGRSHQCATIQLDFQLPIRFNLKYIDEKGQPKMPVIIHRAIYGSFERFLGIITEHYQGQWPFWLNPRQVILLPISEKFIPYSTIIKDQINRNNYYVDIDSSDRRLDKKIREAQVAQYNYILVIGQKELDSQTVNVRYRDQKTQKVMKIDDLLLELQNIQQ